ncbi:hypothetical protein [Nostoc sp. UHCC 0870]|uniref:hypothetical protein n=1 Tax=Nostoc sp. UHCC 0870 TaxID=2914041 RepID=UPI001EDDBC38|nr:hypothetical protein [Nostoc sp. UHCC 0870]UKO99829.1 hypothetical protein L6494_09045 [Nostoc sp. UHCC 0870]
MIRALVESAFQTGYLSVESEGLLHQVLATKCYPPEDLAVLADLCDAVHTGKIKREGSSQLLIESITQYKSCE